VIIYGIFIGKDEINNEQACFEVGVNWYLNFINFRVITLNRPLNTRLEGINMALQHVAGKNKGHIVLYTLSTCPWCRKTKNLLNELGVEYYFCDVDLMADDARKETMRTVEKWNPSYSFPTLVINDSKCIVGFREDEVKAVLK
jgi:glutaredoxin